MPSSDAGSSHEVSFVLWFCCNVLSLRIHNNAENTKEKCQHHFFVWFTFEQLPHIRFCFLRLELSFTALEPLSYLTTMDSL